MAMAAYESCPTAASTSEPDIFLDTGADLKKLLSEALVRIQGPGSFAGGNFDATLPNPGLDIHDHGVVGLPLSATDAQTIKAKCRKSPFGKGAQTIVDESVRGSWELNPDQFTLRNPSWQHAIQALLPQVREQLNLPYEAQHIQAELYKLLLYEEGAFFKAHQDSEKAPGMFGTLIVALPSPHQGGDLAMWHQKDRFHFSTATNSNFGFSWATWYSDIFHEVQPVTSGTRLVLTYNLAIRRDGGTPISVPRALSSFEPRLKAIMRTWNHQVESGKLPGYLVHRLDHQYTEASLCVSALRGSDWGQVEALKAIAAQTDCSLFLATMERVLHCDDDWGDDEIVDSELKLRVVTTLEGVRMSEHFTLTETHLMEEERNFRDREPDKEEHEGFTGNEGSPATYWYRDTVLVIVPDKALLHFTIQGEHKYCAALQKLLELKPHLGCESTLNQFGQLVTILLRREVPNRWVYASFHESKEEQEARTKALKELAYLAVQQHRFEIFNQVAEKIGSDLPIQCFHELGRCLPQTTKALASIELAIAKQDHIATKYETYQSIVRGLDEALPLAQLPANTQSKEHANPEEDITMAWFDQQLIKMVIAQKTEMRKIDGQALAEICIKVPSNGDHKSRMWDLLQHCPHATRVAFCCRLSQAINGSELTTEEHSTFLERVLKYFWDILTVFNPSAQFYDLVRPGSGATTAEFSLTAQELTNMLNVSEQYLTNLGLSKPDVYSTLRCVVQRAKADELVALHQPFAEFMLFKNVKFAQENGEITPEASDLIAYIILEYLSEYVRTEPVAPPDWSQRESMSSCSCSDCSAVNAFLASPEQAVGRFPMKTSRRVHLDRQFTDRAKTSSYSVETKRNSNPHTWQITKNRNVYQTMLRAWKARVAEAKQKLKSMDGAEKRLKSVLGNAYKAAMEANTSAIPPSTGQRNTQALTEGDPNLKRPAPDGPADGSNKKSATSKQVGGISFVDLTGE